METVTLGTTGITVNKKGIGCLPLQRVTHATAVKLLQKAYKAGLRYFDTARAYTDSEAKVGEAFHNANREEIYIATKIKSLDVAGF